MSKNITYRPEEIFSKYATMYELKYMDVEKYHASLNLFLSSLSKKNASILELACGPGNITKYLLSSNPNLQIVGTDLSPEMIKLAKVNNPKARFKLLDCRSILEMKSTYDAIVCGFGLPYISIEDTIKMISDASLTLNESGLIYLSTMEDDYSKSGFRGSSTNPNEGLIMYFHEAKYIEEALINSGFDVIGLSRVEYPNEAGENVTDLIVIGRKK